MPMRWCSGARSWLGARIVALDHWGGVVMGSIAAQ